MKVRWLDCLMAFWIWLFLRFLAKDHWGLNISEYNQLAILLIKILKRLPGSPETETLVRFERLFEALEK